MASLLRMMLVLGLLGAVMFAGSAWIARKDRDRAVETIRALEAELERRIAAHEAMLARLAREYRVAHLHVLRQERGVDGSVISTELLFIELDEAGRELGRQEFRLPGSIVHVDALTVRFDPADVAAGHPLRGRTIMLLRRIYSDAIAPRDGVLLDLPGAVPRAYAAGDVAHFEREIWQDFWALTHDLERAAFLGIRAAQGESVYLSVEEGRVYELRVEAAGGMILRPLEG